MYCKSRNVEFEDIKSISWNGYANLQFEKGSKVKIAKDFICNSVRHLPTTRMRVSAGATLEFGEGSGCSSADINCRNSIIIGKHVNIGMCSVFYDSDYHSMLWKDREDRKIDAKNAQSAPIIIGDYVFIGTRSIILKGVTIGEKTIIQAGSVVNSDIPDNCIAGGNPCKVIFDLDRKRAKKQLK